MLSVLTLLQWSLKPCRTAEISAGIICSCMPILKVLFRGDATKRSPFTFFAALWTRFSVRGFRQQFSSKQTQSSDTLSPDELYNRLGLEGKLGDSDRLNHGIRRSNSNEVVWMSPVSRDAKLSSWSPLRRNCSDFTSSTETWRSSHYLDFGKSDSKRGCSYWQCSIQSLEVIIISGNVLDLT